MNQRTRISPGSPFEAHISYSRADASNLNSANATAA